MCIRDRKLVVELVKRVKSFLDNRTFVGRFVQQVCVRNWCLSYKRTLMNYLGVLLDTCPTCADKHWRRMHVALDTSGYVQAWHPECARQRAESETQSQQGCNNPEHTGRNVKRTDVSRTFSSRCSIFALARKNCCRSRERSLLLWLSLIHI